MYLNQSLLTLDQMSQIVVPYGKNTQTYSDQLCDNQSSTTDSLSNCENCDFEQSNTINFLQEETQQQQKANINELNFSKKKHTHQAIDRFIPNRKASKLDIALSSAHEPNENIYLRDAKEENAITVAQLYKSQVLGIQQNLLIQKNNFKSFNNSNILKFKENSNYILKNSDFEYKSSILQIDENDDLFMQKNTRKIPKVPYKVLDAPALQDDFYLNLIDWNSQNVLAVGLSSCVYLWSAHSSRVTKLCDLGITDAVTSVNWAPRGPYLALGTNSGDIQIWDSVKLKKLRVMNGHSARVGTLAWNTSVLTSGSRDKNILQRDMRTQNNVVSKLVGHKQEVCGLKWSFDDQQLASGGNDNKLFIWNMHSTTPIIKFTNHQAAVKALAWSPHQHGLLVSGGGTADRTIRFWNTLTSSQLDVIDTGSQVCNLIFSKNVNELVSTHGYSLNQIIIWSYPSMEKIVTLTGHTYRVLFLAMSPDGQTIVTGAGDETLRFWNTFPSNNQNKDISSKSKLLPCNNCIR